MKNLILIITILLSFNCLAKKKTDQEKLSLIDDWCGDTMCEGEHGYKFLSLKCGENSCHLKYEKIIDYDENNIENHTCDFRSELPFIEPHYVFAQELDAVCFGHYVQYGGDNIDQ